MDGYKVDVVVHEFLATWYLLPKKYDIKEKNMKKNTYIGSGVGLKMTTSLNLKAYAL